MFNWCKKSKPEQKEPIEIKKVSCVKKDVTLNVYYFQVNLKNGTSKQFESIDYIYITASDYYTYDKYGKAKFNLNESKTQEYEIYSCLSGNCLSYPDQYQEMTNYPTLLEKSSYLKLRCLGGETFHLDCGEIESVKEIDLPLGCTNTRVKTIELEVYKRLK